MKMLKILAALVTATMLMLACATDPEERKKQSQKTFPNQE